MTQKNNGVSADMTCDLLVFDAQQRALLSARACAIFASVESISELSDGYAFRLKGDSVSLVDVAEFIALDRLCCPFVTHGIKTEPHHGSIWLQLTGGDGIKPFILAETTPLLNPDAARAAGFTLPTP